MNYYDERKEKIINELKHIKIYEVEDYSQGKSNLKKNKFKKIYTSIMYIVFFGSLCFILYNYSHQNRPQKINNKVEDIKKIKDPDKFTPLVSPAKKSVDAHKTDKDWIVETPADIKKIEKENGIASPHLKLNKQEVMVNKEKQSNKNEDSLLALSQEKDKKTVVVHPINQNKQSLPKFINKIAVKENKTLKTNNQEDVDSKEKNKPLIKNTKPVNIPPQAEKENSIFAIAPKVKLTNAGWKISQIYHGNAIIVNDKGKSYVVKVGSFVDGHEVLSIKSNEVYMTGNILIK